MAVDRRLYDRLAVSPAATAEELKRAYRRLALQYHPDKCPGHEEEFQEIGKAYSVLSIPSSRRIYDRYGDLGLTVLSTVKSPALVEFLLNTRRLKLMFGGLVLVLFLAACFPFMLAWKVSGRLDWPWVGIFSPLWLLDLTFGALGSLLLYLSWKAIGAQADDNIPTESGGQEVDLNKTTFIVGTCIVLAFFSGLFLQKLFIALKLDRVISWSWWLVLLPYLIVEGTWAIWSALSMAFIIVKWDSAGKEFVPEEDRRLPWAKAYFTLVSLRYIVLRLLLVVVLILKNSSHPEMPWFAVFAPIYIILTFSLFVDLHMDRYKAAHEIAMYTLEQAPPPSSFVIFIKYIPYSISVLITLTFVGLLHSHLTTGTPSWFLVFTPIYIVAIIALLAIALGGFMCYRLIPDFEEIRRQMQDSPSAVVIEGQSVVVDRELEWLRRFGYILGPFQCHISHNYRK
jgi:hypothetical protein